MSCLIKNPPRVLAVQLRTARPYSSSALWSYAPVRAIVATDVLHEAEGAAER